MAMAITAAAEISGMLVPAKLLSSIIATVDASETRINVRWPAAWRLLARSQPIIAAKTTDTATRSSTEYRFNSVDQLAQQRWRWDRSYSWMDASCRSAALKAAVVIILRQIILFQRRLCKSQLLFGARLHRVGQVGLDRFHALNQRLQSALRRRSAPPRSVRARSCHMSRRDTAPASSSPVRPAHRARWKPE